MTATAQANPFSILTPHRPQTPHAPVSHFRPVIVLPTYNNASTLADVARRCMALQLPVYIVNDGSTDDTASILSTLVRTSNVRVLTHTVNQGKAAAMRTAFARALQDGFSHAVTMDTDGQLEPEQIPMLLDAAARLPTALILGVRKFNIDGYPAANQLGRRIANFFVHLESGIRVHDSQCGLRIYPLGFTATVPVRSGRYGYETEVITRAGWSRTPVIEVPVSCRYFEAEKRISHFRPWVDTYRAIGLHARLILRRLTPARHPRWPAAQVAGR